MALSNDYITVGVAQSEGSEPCVVIGLSGLGTLSLPEDSARKLADDILRNTNYLWPEKDTPSYVG